MTIAPESWIMTPNSEVTIGVGSFMILLAAIVYYLYKNLNALCFVDCSKDYDEYKDHKIFSKRKFVFTI